MGKFEPNEEQMLELNEKLLEQGDFYTEDEKHYLLGIMPEIVRTMREINRKDDDLVYDCLFHAVCLKRLSFVRG